jgi:predicted AAA+ superfamily ATPase
MTPISRDAGRLLKQKLEDRAGANVLLIEGARQVGKTTLVEEMLAGRDDTIHLNLETDRATRNAIDQTTNFSELKFYLSNHHDASRKRILFIDEAQESTRLGDYVRSFKESWPELSVILTGSSMSRLFQGRVPVGRFSSLLVTPLNFREFLRFGGKISALEILERFDPSSKETHPSAFIHQEMLNHFDSYLRVGGLPGVVAKHFAGQNAVEELKDIFFSQEEDFVRKTATEDQSLFRAGLRGVANFLGGPSKLTHIRPSHYQSEKIISLLQSWHLVYEVPQMGNSSTTTHHPKRYMYDIGVAHFIREMPFPTLSILNSVNEVLRTQLGGLFENMVLSHLVSERAGLYHISGWKKSPHTGTEVDFIWRDGEDIYPIECKASLKFQSRNFASLKAFMQVSGTKRGFLVSAAPYQELSVIEGRLVNLPIYFSLPEILRKFG